MAYILIGRLDAGNVIWHRRGDWEIYDPETDMLDPREYKTRQRAEKALVTALAVPMAPESAGIIEWDPTQGVAPLEKYMRHERRLPGSPSQ